MPRQCEIEYKTSSLCNNFCCKANKLKVIIEKAQGGNLVAHEYLEKLKNGKVSTDRTNKVLVNSMREQRMLKMITIVEQRNLNHNNPEELIEVFASEMQKQRLDPTNEDDLDGYINSKIM
jgi:ERCC4-related helicase